MAVYIFYIQATFCTPLCVCVRACVSCVMTADFVLTSLFAMGVLSSPGRCCSKARTTQLAVMVARIMYSNGVKAAKLRKVFFFTVQGQRRHIKTDKADDTRQVKFSWSLQLKYTNGNHSFSHTQQLLETS